MSTVTRRGPKRETPDENMEQAMSTAFRRAQEEAEKEEKMNYRALAYIIGIFIFGTVAFFVAHTGRISPAWAIGFMVVLTLVTRLVFLR